MLNHNDRLQYIGQNIKKNRKAKGHAMIYKHTKHYTLKIE